MDRRIIRAAAAALGTAAASAAFAVPYASNITESGGNVTFRLNEQASEVFVIRDGVPQSIGTNLGIGSHTFPRLGATNFSIRVISNNPANAGYTTPTGNPNEGTPFRLYDDNFEQNNINLSFNAPRALVVNRNPATPDLFGRIYVGNANNGTSGGFPTPVRTTGDGFYILGSDYSDITGQGNTALTAGLNFGTGGNSSPWRAALDSDGRVYIADWSDAAGTVYRADANFTGGSGANMLAGQGSSTPIAPTNTLNHGSIAGLVVEGSGSNVNLYVIDEDLSPTGTASQLNSLWLHANVPTNALPTLLTSNVLIGNFAAGGIICDLSRGPDGKFYMSQGRADGNETGVGVVSPNGAEVLYRSLADSQLLGIDGNPGLDGIQDVLRQTRATGISPDGQWMGIIRDNSDCFLVPLLDGTPDLANRYLVDTFDNITLGREFDFDAAGNGFALSSGNQTFRPFSPDGVSETIWSNNGTFRSMYGFNFNGSGNFSSAGNWLLNQVAGSGADSRVTVGKISTGAQTLTLDSNVTLGYLQFAGGNYTVSGNNLTLDSINEPRIWVSGGNATITSAVSSSLNVGFSAIAGSTLRINNMSYTGTDQRVQKFGAGTVEINNVRGGHLIVRDGTLKMIANGGDSGTSVTKRLTIRGDANPRAKLDLNDNDLIVNWDSTDPYATIRAQVASGRNFGAWDGLGINSSAAASNPNQITGLGVVSGADYIPVAGTSFSGQTIDATSTLIKYTYNGDTDLNGSIDFDDYARIDTTFLGGGVTNKWFDGDFDYSDSVDFDDYALIDAAFLLQGGPLDSGRFGGGMTPGGISAGMTAMDIYHLHAEMFGEGYINAFWSLVPEPSSLSLLALGAMAMGRRRRA